jgi:16S rRNA (cytosine1402-N4)-methyltransferase
MSAAATAAFRHDPVLVDLVVDLFAPVPAGLVVDATVGGGGHAAALLEAHEQISLLGLDQDPDALAAAGERLAPFGERANLRRARFDELETILAETAGVAGSTGACLSGALFDLGVSSPQIDRPERGFSMHSDGPIDMRMNPDAATSAADIVNTASVGDLAHILRRFGDERHAQRIARAVVAARPLATTAELTEVVSAAVPSPARRRGSGHPARRTFQALRIAVNEELAILPAALDTAIERLGPGGRCVVLAYHSGEDRIVKERFRHAATGGWEGPVELPPPPDKQPTVTLLRRGAWRPSDAEVAANARARAVRARAVEKLGPPENAFEAGA